MGQIESKISDGFDSKNVLSEEVRLSQKTSSEFKQQNSLKNSNSCKYYTESVPYVRKKSFNKSLTKYSKLDEYSLKNCQFWERSSSSYLRFFRRDQREILNLSLFCSLMHKPIDFGLEFAFSENSPNTC